MDSCAVCKEDLKPDNPVCTRCGSNNAGVDRKTWDWYFETPPWAILSVILPFVPLLMFLPKVKVFFENVASVGVAAPISTLVTAVIAVYLFSMRDNLLEKNQSRTFQEKKDPSLTGRALRYFAAAVVLAFVLGFVVAYKGSLIGSGPRQLAPYRAAHLVFMFVMTACIVLVFSGFTLAMGMMAVYEFGLLAEGRLPDPIYLNEKLMLGVVLRAVRRHIGNIRIPVTELENVQGAGNGGQAEDAGNGQDIELFLIKMERTPDAGMKLQLHEKGKPKTKDKERWLEEKRWLVETDLWARLIKVVEHGDRTIKVEEVKPEPGADDKPGAAGGQQGAGGLLGAGSQQGTAGSQGAGDLIDSNLISF